MIKYTDKQIVDRIIELLDYMRGLNGINNTKAIKRIKEILMHRKCQN